MKFHALIAAVLAFVLPVTASADDLGPPLFAMTVHSKSFDGTKTQTSERFIFQGKSEWVPLENVQVDLPDAIQLDADVPPELLTKLVAGLKTPLTSGSVLFTSIGRRTMSCTPDQIGVFRSLAACLVDLDNDGRFDVIGKAQFEGELPGPWKENKYMYGLVGSDLDIFEPVHLVHTLKLPAPLPYHHVDKEDVPHAWGTISWATNYQFTRPDTLQFMLAYRVFDFSTKMSLLSDPVLVVYKDKPVEVDLHGVKVTITGVTDNGDLIYTIAGQTDTKPIVMAPYFNAMIFWPSK